MLFEPVEPAIIAGLSAPRIFTSDWIRTLEIEKIKDCNPAGMPILMISNV